MYEVQKIPGETHAMKKKLQEGFTLIELMIVVAIVGVLASIAIPEYARHVSRTHAAATVAEVANLRLSITLCIADTGRVTGCDSGVHGIPLFASTKSTLSALVKDGEIFGNSGATALSGVPLTYKMTPVYGLGDAKINWLTTGTICDSVRGLRPGFGGCA